MSRGRKKRIIAFYVEALGDGESALRQWRYATGVPSGDTDQVYLPWIKEKSLPKQLASKIDFRASGASRATIGGLKLQVIATEGTRARSSFPTIPAPGTIPALYRQAAPGRIARALATATAATGNISLDTAGLDGLPILWEREGIQLGVPGGGPPYVYAGSTRGILGTRAEAHVFDGVGDDSIFDLTHWTLPLYRELVMVAVSPTGGYSDEVELWRGAINDLWQPTPETIAIAADDALTMLGEKLLCSDLWRGRGDLVMGEQILYVGKGPLASAAHLGSLRPAMFAIGDRTALRATWQPQGDDETLVWLDRTQDPNFADMAGSPVWGVEDYADVGEIHEFFTTAPIQPAALTSGAGPHNNRLSNNIVDCGWQLLCTTQSGVPGDPGTNGTHDLGMGPNLGCNIDESQLDTDSLTEARALLGEDAVQRAIHLGYDGPIEALEWLQTKLEVCGAMWAPRANNKLGIVIFRDSPLGDEVAINEIDIVRIGRQNRRLQAPLDKLAVTYDDRPGLGPITETFEDSRTLRRHLHGRSTGSLDASGVREETPAETVARIDSMAMGLIQRFHHPIPEWDIEVLGTDTILGVASGDYVTVTDSRLTGLNGTKGVTDALCLVTSRLLDMDSWIVALSLWWVDAIYTAPGRYGPAAVVQAYNPGTFAITVEPNTFSGTLWGDQTDDTYRFEAGQVVEVLTRDRAAVRGTGTIDTVAGGVITLLAGIAGTAAGDLVELADYDTVGAAYQRDHLYLADANEKLGAANTDDAFQWVW